MSVRVWNLINIYWKNKNTWMVGHAFNRYVNEPWDFKMKEVEWQDHGIGNQVVDSQVQFLDALILRLMTMQKLQSCAACFLSYKWEITILIVKTIIMVTIQRAPTLQLLVRIRWDHSWKAVRGMPARVWEVVKYLCSMHILKQMFGMRLPPLSLTC